MFPNREALEAVQLEQLRKLLQALGTNEFYRRKGLKGIRCLQDLQSLPFTTKQELAEDQAASPPYGTNLTFPIDRYTRFHQTSGTKGTPLRWLDTSESWAWMVGNWCEVFKAAGVTSSDRILFAFSFGPFIGFWLAYEAAQIIGALVIPAGGTSSQGRIKLLMENKATVLCCTPTYAAHLAEVAEGMGINLGESAIRLVMVAGEIGGSVSTTRERLQALWSGARVFDHHGMTEVGPVTYECPANPCCLHVNESAYIAEIVDSTTGVTIPAGKSGELILTNLGRIGSPLIRYKTGDYVQAKGQLQCQCGRFDLLLEGGILGRTDDMLIVRGVNIYPGAIEDIVREFKEVVEYQVVVDRQTTIPELVLRIETRDPSSRSVAKNLASRLQEALQLRFLVEQAKDLPRFEMKAKRWIFLD